MLVPLTPQTALTAALLALLSFGRAFAADTVAPVDEYFGQSRLSTLGITNAIRDTRAKVSQDLPHAAKFYEPFLKVENALEDWAAKYPQDRWIPVRAFAMAGVFGKMHTREAHNAAQRCRDLILKRFPESPYAMQISGQSLPPVGPRP